MRAGFPGRIVGVVVQWFLGQREREPERALSANNAGRQRLFVTRRYELKPTAHTELPPQDTTQIPCEIITRRVMREGPQRR